MESAPEFPKRGSEQRRGAARWPVLARLPDVSDDLPASERTSKPATGRTAGYRIDQPERGGSKTGGDAPARLNVGQESLSTGKKSNISSQPLHPHVFERGSRDDIWYRMHHGESPVLPASNPFSIPRPRLADTLAPAVRFATLVALFTAAGVWIQMISHRDQAAAPPATPSATAGQPVLELHPIEQSMAKPSAAGPLGATTPRIVTPIQTQNQTAIRSDAILRNPTLADATGRPLPRVQTTELEFGDGGAFIELSRDDAPTRSGAVANQQPVRLPAVAQAPENVFEDSSRQASHDNHESSLH